MSFVVLKIILINFYIQLKLRLISSKYCIEFLCVQVEKGISLNTVKMRCLIKVILGKQR